MRYLFLGSVSSICYQLGYLNFVSRKVYSDVKIEYCNINENVIFHID